MLEVLENQNLEIGPRFWGMAGDIADELLIALAYEDYEKYFNEIEEISRKYFTWSRENRYAVASTLSLFDRKYLKWEKIWNETRFGFNSSTLVRLLDVIKSAIEMSPSGEEKLEDVINKLKERYEEALIEMFRVIDGMKNQDLISMVLFSLAHYKHRKEDWSKKLARDLIGLESRKFKGFITQLFSDLIDAIDRKDWDNIMRAVCRLYYYYV